MEIVGADIIRPVKIGSIFTIILFITPESHFALQNGRADIIRPYG